MEAFPVSPGARAGPACIMCTSTLSQPATCIHIYTHTPGFSPSLPALPPQGTGNTHLVASPPATDTHAQALSVPHNHNDSPSTHPHSFIQSDCESPTSHTLSLSPSQTPVTRQSPHTTL